MQLIRLHYLAVAALAFAALGAAASAQARDVVWSVGVQVAPGVNVRVGNVGPVYVAPAPVYVAPAPVYRVVTGPVVYVRPAPVVYHACPHHPHKWKSKRKHWQHG